MIEVYRAAIALERGDIPGAVRRSRRALDLLPDEDHLGRAASAGFIGLTSWAAGDLAGAHSAWSECVVGLHQAGHVADTLGCSIALADIRIAQGRLSEALGTLEHALLLAPAQGGVVLRGTADMHVGMSGIYVERNDLHTAEAHLMRSEEFGDRAGLAQNLYRERVVMAHICEVRGDLSGAVRLLDEAERLYVSDYFPNIRPVPAIRARVWIAQAKLDEALRWAKDRGLTVDDDLSYLREFEHITLARLLLAQGSIEDSVELLERLLRAAEGGERIGSVIEIHILLALARQAHGDMSAALTALQHALMLARPRDTYRSSSARVRRWVHF